MTLSQEPRKVGTARNMAVFIDADNLNDATALDHVLTDLRHRAERVLYKRAYGRVDSLKGIESVLWRHGVRPVSNMIVNKVTTDSALVIDAVEAICTQDIDTVAICSGDADFVPLATWVRERGCHVLCFSLSSKIFANPESFYDEVILLEVVEKPQIPAASKIAEPEVPTATDSEPALRVEAEAPAAKFVRPVALLPGPNLGRRNPQAKSLLSRCFRLCHHSAMVKASISAMWCPPCGSGACWGRPRRPRCGSRSLVAAFSCNLRRSQTRSSTSLMLKRAKQPKPQEMLTRARLQSPSLRWFSGC